MNDFKAISRIVFFRFGEIINIMILSFVKKNFFDFFLICYKISIYKKNISKKKFCFFKKKTLKKILNQIRCFLAKIEREKNCKFKNKINPICTCLLVGLEMTWCTDPIGSRTNQDSSIKDVGVLGPFLIPPPLPHVGISTLICLTPTF